MDAIQIWQAILATAGGVALAVAIPLLGFGLAFRPWIQGTIKGELSDFKVEITNRLTTIEEKLSTLSCSSLSRNDFYIHYILNSLNC